MFHPKDFSNTVDKSKITLYRDKWRKRADYIERLLDSKQGRYITPGYIESILTEINDFKNLLQSIDEIDAVTNSLEALSFQCEAALIFCDDKNDPASYLETIKKKILPLLKSILLFIDF